MPAYGTGECKGNELPILLLKPQVARVILRAVSTGVPLPAAAACFGYPMKVTQKWVEVGLRFLESKPKRPARMKEMLEFPEKQMIRADEWFVHEQCCHAILQAVLKAEGRLVSKLVQRMWEASEGNTDIMKFMFKQYTHRHGIVEKTSESTQAEEGTKQAQLVVYLPDNGRDRPAV